MRRGTAFGIALSLHLVLLLLVLRPASDERNPAPARPGNRHALLVRLLPRRPTRPTEFLAVPALHVVAPVVRLRSVAPQRPPQSSGRTDFSATQGSVGDGGFQERLLDARSAHAIHGVPGSSTPLLPGIHFIDPGKQGIAAAMRKAQRLFGVANRHCIDVAAWRQLTPQELGARHISLADVDRLDEEYDCNAPPGLNF
jgi:hypothetical protein